MRILLERIKSYFNSCLNIKREKVYKFIWTNNGKIYMRKSESSDSINIRNQNDLQKL